MAATPLVAATLASRLQRFATLRALPIMTTVSPTTDMLVKRFLLSTTLALFSVLPAAAQSIANDSKSARIDSLMATLVAADAPGAAVLVVKDGKVVLERLRSGQHRAACAHGDQHDF